MFQPVKARDTIVGNSNQKPGAKPYRQGAEPGISVAQAPKRTHYREYFFFLNSKTTVMIKWLQLLNLYFIQDYLKCVSEGKGTLTINPVVLNLGFLDLSRYMLGFWMFFRHSSISEKPSLTMVKLYRIISTWVSGFLDKMLLSCYDNVLCHHERFIIYNFVNHGEIKLRSRHSANSKHLGSVFCVPALFQYCRCDLSKLAVHWWGGKEVFKCQRRLGDTKLSLQL